MFLVFKSVPAGPINVEWFRTLAVKHWGEVRVCHFPASALKRPCSSGQTVGSDRNLGLRAQPRSGIKMERGQYKQIKTEKGQIKSVKIQEKLLQIFFYDFEVFCHEIEDMNWSCNIFGLIWGFTAYMHPTGWGVWAATNFWLHDLLWIICQLLKP